MEAPGHVGDDDLVVVDFSDQSPELHMGVVLAPDGFLVRPLEFSRVDLGHEGGGDVGAVVGLDDVDGGAFSGDGPSFLGTQGECFMAEGDPGAAGMKGKEASSGADLEPGCLDP